MPCKSGASAAQPHSGSTAKAYPRTRSRRAAPRMQPEVRTVVERTGRNRTARQLHAAVVCRYRLDRDPNGHDVVALLARVAVVLRVLLARARGRSGVCVGGASTRMNSECS
jgi:hypothetical protein